MANLVSPGVQISVTDESFFTSAGPGTIPLIFISTKENKPTPDGASIAPGTQKASANELYLISSQRELLQTFGNPDFKSVGGSAQNGNPLNEYGLLAAHSFLGVSNRAYVVRSDVALEQLEPSTNAPTGRPVDLTYWADLNNLTPGLFVSTATGAGNWESVSVTIVEGTITTGAAQPSSGFINGDVILAAGSDGKFAFWKRVAGSWQPIINFVVSPHTSVPSASSIGQFWLKTTTPNQGASINVKLYDSEVGSFVDAGLVLIRESTSDYYDSFSPSTVAAGTLVAFTEHFTNKSIKDESLNHTEFQNRFTAGVDYNVDDVITLSNGAEVTVNSVDGDGAVEEFTITAVGSSFSGALLEQDSVVDSGSDPAAGTGFSLTVEPFNLDGQLNYELRWHNGESQASVTSGAFDVTVAGDLIINGVTVALLTTDTVSDAVAKINNASISNIVAFEQGTAIKLVNTSGRDITVTNSGGLVGSGITNGVYSNFKLISDAVPAYEASFSQPVGATTVGTLWFDPSFKVDILVKDVSGDWVTYPGEVYVQSDEPTSPTVGDLWVETDQLDNYPVIRRWNGVEWVLVDNTDQTTPNGIIFADARVSPTSSVVGAPDPNAFPNGMLLWNTQFSSRNVKQWDGNKWVSISGTNADGSLITGQAAVRRVVVNALRASVLSNEEIRSETLFANLFAAPGFPELAGDLVTLNIDRRETGFVVADTDFDLAPSGTELQNWARDNAVASENVAYYYPSALATNLDGTEVVVPASHMALRVFATNDQVSYPWFAPAGFQRGVVTNVRQVGYLNGEDEFVTVNLNQGQRDILYLNNINPIVNFPGRGIIILGQKTRSPVESALDRVNVARLISYIRFQAERIAEPFLFEPNDSQTRNAVRDRFETFLAELVTLRGVFDFLVVVDETNNTPARIDRNELWIDLAISPAKSVEFIYIPIRVRNTGADLSL